MTLIHRTNEETHAVWVGGRLIQPGCFLTDDAAHVAPSAEDEPEPEPKAKAKAKPTP